MFKEFFVLLFHMLLFVICIIVGVLMSPLIFITTAIENRVAPRSTAGRRVYVNEYPDGSLGHVAWSFKTEAGDYTIDGVKPVRQVEFVEVIQ